jgi:hypothetical protein
MKIFKSSKTLGDGVHAIISHCYQEIWNKNREGKNEAGRFFLNIPAEKRDARRYAEDV